MHLERFGELYEHDNEKMRTGDCPTPKYELLTRLPPIDYIINENAENIRIIQDRTKQRLPNKKYGKEIQEKHR